MRPQGPAQSDRCGRGALHRPELRPALRRLPAESQYDAALAQVLHDRLIAARRAGAAEVLRRGITNGELRPDLDVDVAIDALYGPWTT
ncbi:MAG: TetR/AcrR family transcriptional regulator C-terminal ligand-binding domain-containing protein, partial [Acidobacteria bacterium]|nr:TetR/AcrR family transcriptional regulator C-terminal ligand-binding domain-containing protein [Acidobacteriota bacterium]